MKNESKQEVAAGPDTAATKGYRVEAFGAEHLADAPNVAIFEVDLDLAREIVRLASVVSANGLQVVERADARAQFVRGDIELAHGEHSTSHASHDDEPARTDWGNVVVSAAEFYFAAELDTADARLTTSRQSIAHLAEHFGLEFGDASAERRRVAATLDAMDEYALVDALTRRGRLVTVWSPDDFEFIGNKDDTAAALSDEELENVQVRAFEACRRGLEEVTTSRGNEYLEDWWALKSHEVLPPESGSTDRAAPRMR